MVAELRIQDTEGKQGNMEVETAKSCLLIQQNDKDCTGDNRSFLKPQRPLLWHTSFKKVMPPSPSQTFLAKREPSIQIYDPIGVMLIQTTIKANIVNIHTQAKKR